MNLNHNILIAFIPLFLLSQLSQLILLLLYCYHDLFIAALIMLNVILLLKCCHFIFKSILNVTNHCFSQYYSYLPCHRGCLAIPEAYQTAPTMLGTAKHHHSVSYFCNIFQRFEDFGGHPWLSPISQALVEKRTGARF